MACWLYQMDVSDWPHERYRDEVWEGSITQNWGIGKIKPIEERPHAGDLVILFYVKTHSTDPGIYGWGVVSWCDRGVIHFRPAPPSDYLKMSPMYDEELDRIVNNIRGKLSTGTMWKMDMESLTRIRQKISQYTCGRVSKTRLNP